MEPGHEDREYPDMAARFAMPLMPQWSPVMKTGNTRGVPAKPWDMVTSLNGARS